jgi:hypothetical protein
MRYALLFLFLAGFAGCAPHANAVATTTAQPAASGSDAEILRHLDDRTWVVQKLASMAAADQDARNNDKPFEDLDRAHTHVLKLMLTRYRWFTIDTFGKEADQNAWLLVQHADLDPGFQSRMLTILEGLPNGQTDPKNVAYLHDRVACGSIPCTQRYGTQGHCVGKGRWEPFPIEEPDRVDERRRSVGMESLAEYQKMFVDFCK